MNIIWCNTIIYIYLLQHNSRSSALTSLKKPCHLPWSDLGEVNGTCTRKQAQDQRQLHGDDKRKVERFRRDTCSRLLLWALNRKVRREKLSCLKLGGRIILLYKWNQVKAQPFDQPRTFVWIEHGWIHPHNQQISTSHVKRRIYRQLPKAPPSVFPHHKPPAIHATFFPTEALGLAAWPSTQGITQVSKCLDAWCVFGTRELTLHPSS